MANTRSDVPPRIIFALGMLPSYYLAVAAFVLSIQHHESYFTEVEPNYKAAFAAFVLVLVEIYFSVQLLKSWSPKKYNTMLRKVVLVIVLTFFAGAFLASTTF